MKITITKQTPILVLCEMGLDRSGCMKIELVVKRGYRNILNAGTKSTSKETLGMLTAWAQLILVIADQSVWDDVPWDVKGKSIFENIGKDIWLSPENPQLQVICRNIANKLQL